MFDPEDFPEPDPVDFSVACDGDHIQVLGVKINLDVIHSAVACSIVAQTQSRAKEQVQEIVKQEASKVIQQEVQELIRQQLEVGIQLTNEWGEPKGPVKPLREIMREEIAKHINHVQTFDRRTRLQELVAKAVEEQFKQACKAEIDKFMEGFKSSILLQCTTYLKQQIEKVVK